MLIHGFNKTTLLDYPGKVAAVLFLGGCNFRCPYCHNSGLVLAPSSQPVIPLDEILSVLKKRRKILDGVCVTGGEPTLDKDLFSLLFSIKELGYAVKLDTNGTHPWVIKKLVKNHLVDMIAMDIKSSPQNYAKAAGLKHIELGPVMESVEFLKSGAVDYEFRTTAVRELHTEEDFFKIGEWLAKSKAYCLQAYRDSADVIQPGFSSFSKKELEHFQSLLSRTISSVQIRGID